mgnify:CR=1 FL=1
MNKIELDIKSPWALLISIAMFITFFTVIVLADDEVVGHTEHGIPVLESEVTETDFTAIGLRQLDIKIKSIKKIDTNVLNINTLELTLDDIVYTIIVSGCKLTKIDNFQWQTRGDGALNVGDFAIVRRNPFKYFDNPALELSKEQVDAKLKNWDLNKRTCHIVALQKAGKIKQPGVVEGIRE